MKSKIFNFIGIGCAFLICAPTSYAQPIAIINSNSFNSSLTGCNDSSKSSLIITNNGSSNLIYNLDAGGPDNGTLEQVLNRLNKNYTDIISLIPNRYDFTNGLTNYYIADGGLNMYDYGNYIHTNFQSYINYSENKVISSSAFGNNGRYFTKKNTGLWVLAADIDSISNFEINGDLGASGLGNSDTATLTLQIYGKTYKGFVKRVYNTAEPSVNHLVIVEQGDTINHNYNSYTGSDMHIINNLTGKKRIYYLLYASAGGGYINNTTTLSIMKKFLESVDPIPDWMSFLPASGAINPSSSDTSVLTFFSSFINEGIYSDSIYLNSNDLANPRIGISLNLSLNGFPNLIKSDTCLDFGSIMEYTTNTRKLYFANSGCDTLNITNITSTLSEYTINKTSFYILPGDTDSVTVTFSPKSVNNFNATLNIFNDDKDTSVCLKGISTAKPLIITNPDSINVLIASCNDSLVKTISITNSGTGNLIYSIGAKVYTNSLKKHCIPATNSYCCSMGIYNVKFNTINFSSNDGVEGYRDYTDSLGTIVTAGQQVLMTVQTGASYNENVRAWIDYNNNGIFEASEKVFESLNKLINHSGTVVIPSNTAKGVALRMRVASDYYTSAAPEACNNVTYGQHEDYSIFVMEITSTGDTLAGGASKIINIEYNSKNLDSRTHRFDYVITSNDPLNPKKVIKSKFTVDGEPIISLSDTCLAFDTIMRNTVAKDTVVVINKGCDTLFIYNIISSNSSFSVDTLYHLILPGDTSQIIVSFNPITAGNFTGNLDLFGNTGNQKICLSGYATESPKISALPTSLNVIVNSCNDSISKPLKLYNKGLNNLIFNFNKSGLVPKNPSCTPITTGYCCGMGIYNVTFNTINNTTGNGVDSYKDYSSTQKTKVTKGKSYSIYVKTGTSYDEHVVVWIDFNNSGTFETSEKVFYDLVRTDHYGTVQIPSNAVTGTALRMRVGSEYYGNGAPAPCTNVQYGQFEDYTIIINSGVYAATITDTLITNDSTTINVKFQSTGLQNGNYYSWLIVESNDPLTPTLTIPCTLKVNGATSIALSDTCIDFGSIMENTVKKDTFTITNSGCDTLFITDINKTLGIYTVSDTSLTILPFENKKIIVSFSPVTTGTFNDVLTIKSNTSDKILCLKGSAYEKPKISVNPANFNVVINSCNDSINKAFKIYNTEPGTLIYDFSGGLLVYDSTSFQNFTTSGATTIHYFNKLHLSDTIFLTITLNGDFNSTSEKADLYIDDELQFEVYDGNGTPSNGNDITTTYSFTGSNVSKWLGDGKLVVRLNNSSNVGTGYGDFHKVQLKLPGLKWIIASKTADTLVSSDSTIINIKFKSTNLVSNAYTSSLKIYSNDPVTPIVNVPCTLKVNGTPKINLSANCLNMGSIMEQKSNTDTLFVYNSGCDTLKITDINNVLNIFSVNDTSFYILPWDTATTLVTFSPTSTGTFNDTLKIYNNDVLQTVCLSGSGLPKAIISIKPASFNETISSCNDSITKQIKIYNSGLGDLIYTLNKSNITPKAPSCSPITTSTCCGMGTYNVTFNTINNTTGNATEGYKDYSSTVSTTVTTGKSYPIYVQTSTSYDEYVVIWIDFNNSGTFETSEKVFNDMVRTNHYGTIQIPTNAVTGAALRMRVVSEYSGQPAPTNCNNVAYGQVEDYAIVIRGGIYTTSITDTIASNDSSTVNIKFQSTELLNGNYYTSVLINSNDPIKPQLTIPCTLKVAGSPIINLSDNCFNLDSIMEFTIRFDTLFFSNTGCDTLSITSIANSLNIFSLSDSAFTIYPGDSTYLTITYSPKTVGNFKDTISITSNAGNRKVCLSGKSYAKPLIIVAPDSFEVSIISCSDSLTFPLNIKNSGTGILNYTLGNNTSSIVKPATCTPITTGTCCGMGIYNVTFNTINNTTGNATEGYKDYSSSISTKVQPGKIYPISIQTGTTYNEHTGVWIDFDNSGTFEISEKVFSTISTYQYHTGNITIPSNATSGLLRMRVGSEYFGSSEPQPCNNVQYGQFEDYAVILSGGISLSDSAGTLLSGDSTYVDVKFNSTGLFSGLYKSNIVINSNDPITPQIIVPANFTIIGEPAIELSASCLAMDSIIEQTSITNTIQITNNGCDTLLVTNITKLTNQFSTNKTSFVIPPLKSENLIVTFSPSVSGALKDTLTILNNDKTQKICLSGYGLPKAVISIVPKSFKETIASCNDSIIKTLKVYNSGAGNLIFTFNKSVSIPKSASCTPQTIGTCCSMGIYNVTFNTINNTTGNATEGYKDYSASISTIVDIGKTYSISITTGTTYNEHTGVWIDYNNSGTFEPSEQVFATNNTYKTHTGNITIPVNVITGIPLRMRVGSEYYAYSAPSPCTNVQYGQFEDYAIVINAGVIITSVTDTISTNDSTSINIKFKSTGLYNGNYYSNLSISSNDPLNPIISIPCTLIVSGNPGISLSDNCLNLDSIMEYTTHKDTVTITNTGCDTLKITNITKTNSAYTINNTSFNVAPSASQMVIVTFSPITTGTFIDTLKFTTNVTNPTVCLIGKSYAKPAVSVTPSSFYETIASCNDSISKTLKVFNNGTGNLIYNIPDLNTGGNALHLDGSGDYIDVTDNNSLDMSNAVTIETWLYVNTIQETWTAIIGKPGRNYTMWLNNTGYIHFSYYNQASSNINISTPAGAITTGKWYHVACVLDVNAGIFKIYIDGVEKATGTPNGYPKTSTSPFRMGNNLDNGSGNYLNGKLDEVRLWNKALSQTEIQNRMNYSANGLEQGLTGYWNFNDGTAKDKSPNGNNGTMFGNAYIGSSNAPIQSFVSVSKNSDTLTTGDSTLISVKFKSKDKNSGIYTTSILINSNDPLKAQLSIPCTLKVIGSPKQTISASCVAFDTTMQMTSSKDSIKITNIGCDTLKITSISTSTGIFSVNKSSLTLLPANSAQLVITFSPTVTGTFTDTVTVISNDANAKVCLSGIGGGAPVIYALPKSLNVSISTCGDSLTQNIKVKNTGTGILYIDGHTKEATGRSALFANTGDYMSTSAIPITSTGAYTLEAWAKFPLPTTTGGYRTLFQYGSNRHHVLVNSSGLLGVYYNGFYSSGFNVNALSNGWHFISAVASGSKTDFYIDGELVGTSSYYLNYSLYYFGNYVGGGQQFGTVDEIRIWKIARTASQIKASMNTKLVGNETNLLAYYHFDDGTAIDQSVNSYNGTFQNAATTTQGNFDPITIATFTTKLDTIAFGDSITMLVKIKSNDLESGTYIDSLEITSNDPITPSVTIKCTLTVTGYAKIVLKDSCITADSTMALTSSTDTFKIYNKGCDPLIVSNITKLTTIYSVNKTSFTITPGDSTEVIITFLPLSTGTFPDTLTIVNNNVNKKVCLSGYGFGQSKISVVPTSYKINVTSCTDSVVKPFSIINTGQSNLIWNLQIGSDAGKALDFDGGSDYVSIGNTALNSISTAITVEGWIYPRTSTAYEYILSNDRDCCGSYKGYSLRITGGYPQFQIWDNSSIAHNVNSPSTVSTSQWHHIAGTFDGTTLKLYVDGVLVNTSSFTGTIGTPATYNLAIGAMGMSSSTYNLNGLLDEVRIWTVVRSSQQIKEAMITSLIGNETGLKGYWKFNEGTGTVLQDATANNYDGTINGAAWVTSSALLYKMGADSVSGTVAKGDTTPVNITFYTNGFENVTIYSSFNANSNDPLTPQINVPCTVKVDAAPSAPVGKDTTICFGNPTPNLSVTGTDIKWYKNSVLDTVIASGNSFATGKTAVGIYTYYSTQTINGCESPSDTVILTINGSTAAPIVPDTVICLGEPIPTLNASGTYVSWYSNSALTNKLGTGNNFTPSDSMVGIYKYYVTDSVSKCPESPADTVTFTINSIPAAPAARDTLICYKNTQPTLNATGTKIKWYDNSILTTLLDTGNSYIPTGDTLPGVYDYYITQTINNCESPGKKVTLTINSIPTKPVATDKSVCYGFATPSLSTTGTYIKWFSNPALTILLKEGLTYSTGKTDSGTYNYYVTDSITACPKSIPDTATLIIKSTPPPPVVSDTTICYGVTTPDLIATGTNIRWFNNSTLTSLAQTGSPFATGKTNGGVYTYYVIQNKNGCQSPSVIQTLTINQTAMPSALDTTICFGQTTPLLTSTGTNVKWYIDKGLDTLINSGNNYSTGKTAVGIYPYYITQTLNTCESFADTSVLTINTSPVKPKGTDTSICFGDPTPTLSSTGINIKWFANANLTNLLKTGNTYSSGKTAAGTYNYYIVDSINSCPVSISDTVTMTIKGTPSTPVSNDVSVCFGQPTPDLTATGTSIKWYKNAALDTVIAAGNSFATGKSSVGIYTYYVTQTVNGCKSNADVVTLTINTPASKPSATDKTVCFGKTPATLSASGNYLQWYNSPGLSTVVHIGSSYTTSDVVVGQYFYYVTDSINGCPESAPDTAVLTINALPSQPTASDTTICYGTPTPNLTSTGTDVKWYFDTKLSQLVYIGNSFATGKTAAGTYMYYVTQTINGCASMPDTSVLVIDKTIPPTVTDTAICVGVPVPDLKAQGTNIKWYNNGTLDTLLATGNSYATGKTAIGKYTYYVTQTVNNCISDTASVALSINNKPAAPVLSDTITCESDGAPLLYAVSNISEWYSNASLTNFLFKGNPYKTLDSAVGNYTYYVVENNAGCYSEMDSLKLTINATPAAPTASNKTICEGSSNPILTATGTNIKWYNDAGLINLVGTGINYTPKDSTVGNHYYYVTDSINGCASPATVVTFSITSTPAQPVASDSTVCYGTIAGLSAKGTNLNWYKDAALTNKVGSGTLFLTSDTAIGTFKYYVTDGLTGCESTADTATLTIISSPSIPAGNDTTICFGSPTPNLSAAGTNLKWYGDSTLKTVLFAGNNFVSGKTGSGIYKYFVTQSIGNCESGADKVTLVILPNPVPPIVSDTAACAGNPIPDLVASGNYVQWYTDSTLQNKAHTGNIFATGKTAEDVYIYYVTDSVIGCGVSAPSIVSLTIANTVSTPVGKDAVACEFTVIPDITATGNNVFWYSDSSLSNLVNTGSIFKTGKTKADKYTYFITDSLPGCGQSASIQVQLTINPAPSSELVSDTAACFGNPTPDLVANGSNIKWYKNTLLDSVISTSNTFSTGKTATGTYIYYVTQTDSITGCISNPDTVKLNISSLPNVPVAGNDTISCEGSTNPALTATGSNLNWYSDAQLNTLLFVGNAFIPSDSSAGAYKYYVTDGFSGCESTADSILLTINTLPSSPATSDTSVCFGNAAPELVAQGINIKWYSDSLLLNFKVGGNLYQPLDSTIGSYAYFATQTDSVNNCESKASKAIFTVLSGPAAPVAFDTTVCYGKSLVLTAQGLNIHWYSDSLIQNLINKGNSYVPSDTSVGNYTYYLTDSFAGCISSITAIALTINSVALPPSVSDQFVCEGDISPVFIASGSNIRWYNDSALTDLVHIGNNFISPEKDPGQYFYFLTDGTPGNCMSQSSKATLNIKLNPETPISFDKAACAGGLIPPLTAIGTNVKWYSDSLLSNLKNTGNNFNVTDSLSGTFLYYVIDSIDGCFSLIEEVKLIIANTLASPSVADEIICETKQIPDLFASGSNVKWYNDVTLNNLVNSGNTFSSGNTAPGNYTYFVTDSLSASCKSSASTINLTIVASPAVPSVSDTNGCYGGIVPDLIATGSNILWFSDSLLNDLVYKGDTFSSNVSNFGTYTYYVVDSIEVCGKSKATKVNLKINTKPLVTVNKTITTIGIGDSTLLEAYNALTYLWFPSIGLSDSTGSSVKVSPLTTQIYTVVGINKYGCFDSATITVIVDSLFSVNEMQMLEKSLLIYPNPTLDKFTAEFKLQKATEPVTLSLINSLGQTIQEQKLIDRNGFYRYTFDVHELSTGIYNLRIATNKGIVNRLVVVGR